MTTKQIQFFSDIEPVRRQLEGWRRTREHNKDGIPEALWSAMARLARIHGVSRVARELGVEYYSLRHRAEVVQSAKAKATGQHDPFVEMSLAAPPPSAGCVVELEDRRGWKMTLRLAAANGADAAALVEAFWRRRP